MGVTGGRVENDSNDRDVISPPSDVIGEDEVDVDVDAEPELIVLMLVLPTTGTGTDTDGGNRLLDDNRDAERRWRNEGGVGRFDRVGEVDVEPYEEGIGGEGISMKCVKGMIRM